ncbi:permease-like cell division protein FtsX [Ruminiclostridium cellobioparum]|jgi:cell division transport system permease protein|uniref:Cell division protein FtsX n=2 Tax=Ruminiclostridium cellobioparum TaxID=29355 RepID=S0FGX6_RUMCE|nr:permease-like cell division protein FtsX [Ruminiclostridium cellobioparum]EMS70845.1 Cell division protein [Ruminiclostridium cellobioparum subsp. termitidis CT1112]
MKIRSLRYILKESFKNAYRNRLMSLASISIISAALILFGVFYLILINLNHNLDLLYKTPQMQVNCLPELTDEQVEAVKTEIANNQYIESYEEVSKKEAFEKLKQYLDTEKKDLGGSDILEGYDESMMFVSFTVKVKDPQNSASVAKELESLAGVDNVRYSQKTIDFILQVSNWVKIVSFVLIGLLLIISLFIISNTIKLTVFARRKEINIMKYIGATDWFIRWPFVFEGVLMGFLGAVIAFVLVAYIYGFAQPRLSEQFSGGFEMVQFGGVWSTLILIYVGISALIGASGSVMSIRKHLHV